MRPESRAERFAFLVSSISGTAAYLLLLGEFYPWWIVAPVTLLALPIALICSVMVMEFASTPVGRMICLILGGGLLWLGVTQDQRNGSACMGIAIFLPGAMARKAS